MKNVKKKLWIFILSSYLLDFILRIIGKEKEKINKITFFIKKNAVFFLHIYQKQIWVIRSSIPIDILNIPIINIFLETYSKKKQQKKKLKIIKMATCPKLLNSDINSHETHILDQERRKKNLTHNFDYVISVNKLKRNIQNASIPYFSTSINHCKSTGASYLIINFASNHQLQCCYTEEKKKSFLFFSEFSLLLITVIPFCMNY